MDKIPLPPLLRLVLGQEKCNTKARIIKDEKHQMQTAAAGSNYT